MRIIVASDNKSTRDAIAMLVRVQPDLELAGEVDDIVDLLAKIKATESPLVVFDWDALGQRIDTLMDLLELVQEPPSIVALSVHRRGSGRRPFGGNSGFRSQARTTRSVVGDDPRSDSRPVDIRAA